MLTQTPRTMGDRRMMMMRTAPHTQYAFHLCSDVPALCSHMHFFRYPQHSMNHREQFTLSVVTTSETIFRLCVTVLSLVCWCCSAKTVTHQILSTRLSEIQMSPFAVINPQGLVSFESVDTMLPYVLVARQCHWLPQRRDDQLVYR